MPSFVSSRFPGTGPQHQAADTLANVATDQAALADLLSLCHLGRPRWSAVLEQIDRAQAFAAPRAVSLMLLGLATVGAFSWL